MPQEVCYKQLPMMIKIQSIKRLGIVGEWTECKDVCGHVNVYIL